MVGIVTFGSVTMLKLSTKTSYGLRACLALATAEGKLSSTEIAEREGIPRRYLEQILVSLRQGGLVESTRGARGGYSLLRNPAEITIASLVTILEGSLPPLLCSVPELQSETCRTDSNCACRHLCFELENSLMSVLEGTTLSDILAQMERSGSTPNRVIKSLKTPEDGDAWEQTLSQSVPSISTST